MYVIAYAVWTVVIFVICTGADIFCQAQLLFHQEIRLWSVRTVTNPTTWQKLSVTFRNLQKNLLKILNMFCQGKVATGRSLLRSWFVICSCLTGSYSDLGKNTMTVKKPLNSVMPWQPIVTDTNWMLLVLARRSYVQFYVKFSVLLQSNMALGTQSVEVDGTGWWYMILSFQVYRR